MDNAEHRTSVTELSGRKVTYGYDSIYRLTNETITNDPASMNGAVSYVYDAVGNRTQKTSTLPGYPGGLSNYNANDELASDTYDADGNTTLSQGLGYAYDFENRLVQAGAGINIIYDGDGNRVSKTVAGVNTKFLVDEANPTGYAQVMDEVQSSGVVRTYTWGLELISELFPVGSPLSTNHSPLFYVFDGHGSVRALTNSTGNVTDTYDYDAFGNLIHSTGTSPNNYLFAGEQHDPDLSLYYNRARYLNTSTDRFWSMDTLEGNAQEPLSLHKYLYVDANPSGGIDPSGNEDLAELSISSAVDLTLNAMSTIQVPVGGGGPGAQLVSRILVPQNVWQDLLDLTPDAVEFGANVAGSVNLRNPVIGFAAGGGVELLGSPRTGNWAAYTYVSPAGLTAGATATSIGGGITGGLVYRSPTSSDYEGQFYTVSIPLAVLPPNVRTKIAGDWAIASFQGIGATIPAAYTSVLAAARSGLGNAFSNNGAINIFVSPTGSHALGFSLALGKSLSVGASTSNWSVAWSYYWQDAPSNPVPFE
jgi:RHS repeat-associated protein